MSGPLTDEAEAIIAALPESCGTGHTYVPNVLHPPAAMALWAGLSREDDDTYSSWTNNYDVWLVCDNGPNNVVTDALHTKVWDAIRALHAEGFQVRDTSEPFTYSTQGGNYLAVILHAATGLNTD